MLSWQVNGLKRKVCSSPEGEVRWGAILGIKDRSPSYSPPIGGDRWNLDFDIVLIRHLIRPLATFSS